MDREAFAERARRLGFDEAAYLAALDRVPVISHAHLQKTIGFLADFVEHARRDGRDGAAARAQARAAGGERGAVPAASSTTPRGSDRVPRRAGRGRRGRATSSSSTSTRSRRGARGPRANSCIGRRLSECDGERRAAARLLRRGEGRRRSPPPARRAARCTCAARDAYELLSAYPAAQRTSGCSPPTDVTELREAERALRRQEEGIRHAYVDVLDAVTGGKLILLTDEQLADELGTPLGQPARLRRAVGSSPPRAPHDRPRRRDLLPRQDPAHRPAEHRRARRSTTRSSTPAAARTRRSRATIACRSRSATTARGSTSGPCPGPRSCPASPRRRASAWASRSCCSCASACCSPRGPATRWSCWSSAGAGAGAGAGRRKPGRLRRSSRLLPVRSRPRAAC